MSTPSLLVLWFCHSEEIHLDRQSRYSAVASLHAYIVLPCIFSIHFSAYFSGLCKLCVDEANPKPKSNFYFTTVQKGNVPFPKIIFFDNLAACLSYFHMETVTETCVCGFESVLAPGDCLDKSL